MLGFFCVSNFDNINKFNRKSNMNSRNRYNWFITYTLVLLSDNLKQVCMKVAEYLVENGHKVTIIPDALLEKQNEDWTVIKNSVEESDLTIVFSTNEDILTENIRNAVRLCEHTYIVRVVSGKVPLASRDHLNGFDNVVGSNELLGWMKKDEQIKNAFCNLAAYD